MTACPHFTPALFGFLSELADTNNREWFQDNKARYERDVRDALVNFVIDFGEILQEVSPHMVADPRLSGGSIFRIYRDVRFSKDKSPYKTNAGIHFRHEVGRKVHGPGTLSAPSARQRVCGRRDMASQCRNCGQDSGRDSGESQQVAGHCERRIVPVHVRAGSGVSEESAQGDRPGASANRAPEVQVVRGGRQLWAGRSLLARIHRDLRGRLPGRVTVRGVFDEGGGVGLVRGWGELALLSRFQPLAQSNLKASRVNSARGLAWRSHRLAVDTPQFPLLTNLKSICKYLF